MATLLEQLMQRNPAAPRVPDERMAIRDPAMLQGAQSVTDPFQSANDAGLFGTAMSEAELDEVLSKHQLTPDQLGQALTMMSGGGVGSAVKAGAARYLPTFTSWLRNMRAPGLTVTKEQAKRMAQQAGQTASRADAGKFGPRIPGLGGTGPVVKDPTKLRTAAALATGGAGVVSEVAPFLTEDPLAALSRPLKAVHERAISPAMSWLADLLPEHQLGPVGELARRTMETGAQPHRGAAQQEAEPTIPQPDEELVQDEVVEALQQRIAELEGMGESVSAADVDPFMEELFRMTAASEQREQAREAQLMQFLAPQEDERGRLEKVLGGIGQMLTSTVRGARGEDVAGDMMRQEQFEERMSPRQQAALQQLLQQQPSMDPDRMMRMRLQQEQLLTSQAQRNMVSGMDPQALFQLQVLSTLPDFEMTPQMEEYLGLPPGLLTKKSAYEE